MNKFIDALMSAQVRYRDVEQPLDVIIEDFLRSVEYEHAVASAMADTNATGYSLDDYEVTKFTFEDNKLNVFFEFTISGEDDEEHAPTGNVIEGTGSVSINEHDEVVFGDVSASVTNGPSSDEYRE
jgi:hypothetical protein